MGGKSKSTQTTQQTQTSTTPDWLTPYIQQTAPMAQNLLNQGTPQYYQGDLVAPFSQPSAAGIEGLANYGAQGFRGLNAGYGAAGRAMSGFDPGRAGMARAAYGPDGTTTAGVDTLQQMASGGSNPFLDATFDRAANRVRNQVDSAFARSGMSGSGAYQNLLTDGLNNLATDIYGGAYESDQGRRMGAAGQLAGIQQGDFGRRLAASGALSDSNAQSVSQGLQGVGALGTLYGYGQQPYETQIRAGSALDTQNQNMIDAEMQRYNFNRDAPWMNLQRYAQVVNPLAGIYNTQNTSGTTTSTQRANPFNQILGGAMMASSLFGNPFGAKMGAGMMLGGG